MKKRTKVTLILAGAAATALAVKVVRDIAKYRKQCEISKNDSEAENHDDLEEFLKDLAKELDDEYDAGKTANWWEEEPQTGGFR